jgi:outer membrane protein TolC
MSYSRQFRRRSLWLAVLLGTASLKGVAAPLTLEEALRLAERNAPSLATQDARIEAARQSLIPAGALPDPKLVAGLDSFPVSGPNRFSLTQDDFTMLRIGLMQEIPNGDKRRARVAAAESRLARSEAEREIERLTLRQETTAAWIKRWTVEHKLDLFASLVRENRLLADAVQAHIAGGRGSITDAVLPRQEAALLAERQDDLEAQRQQAIAGLRRWIGADGGAPLAGDLPVWPVTRATFLRHLHHHPVLAAFAPEGQLLDAEVREAQASKQPDWTVEFDYQRRDEQFGDMVTLEFTVDLPLFAAHRQDPQIAAKRAERLSLESEREAMTRAHTEKLEVDLAEHERLERAVYRQRNTLLPLAREKTELTLAAYRSGKAELTAVLAARRERLDEQLKLIDLQGQQSQVAARLHLAYGEQYQ